LLRWVFAHPTSKSTSALPRRCRGYFCSGAEYKRPGFCTGKQAMSCLQAFSACRPEAKPTQHKPSPDPYEVIKVPRLPDLSHMPTELQVFRDQCAAGKLAQPRFAGHCTPCAPAEQEVQWLATAHEGSLSQQAPQWCPQSLSGPFSPP
jgi:hypothetical protein